VNYFPNQNYVVAKNAIEAIDLYYTDFGEYPDDIDQLVPEYLEIIPNSLLNSTFDYAKHDYYQIWNDETRRYEDVFEANYRLSCFIGEGWYRWFYTSYNNEWWVTD
jgi:hypothetical protein